MPTSDGEHAADPSNRTGSNSSLRARPSQNKRDVWRTQANGSLIQVHDDLARQETVIAEAAHEDNHPLNKATTLTLLGGKLRFRARDDDGPSGWWFASTAIPLMSATFAPMANLLSIAALVVYWRNTVTTDDPVQKYATSIGHPDPPWCLNLNGASLAIGFIGNIFLLCNFTRKIRYIIALPVTILLFYIASGILIGITISMNIYDPPKADQVYSQGYWHAVVAAALYMLNAMLLMVNMLGDLTRGLVFPYTVGGGIILGLMVSSIHEFAQELSKENVIKKHVEMRRINTLSRAVSTPELSTPPSATTSARLHSISRPLEGDQIQQELDERARYEKVQNRIIGFDTPVREDNGGHTDAEPLPEQFRSNKDPGQRRKLRSLTLERAASLGHRIPVLLPSRNQKAILMRDEKDRFDRMRKIQHAAKDFKKWYVLTMSVLSFGLLWCVGAVVFWLVESETQRLSYFQALYFCYVSLLTVGYGDLSPKSNAGKPFFILWSLIAVPTMTILISDHGDTAIGGFKRKVLDYGGLAFLGKGRGWGLDWFSRRKEGLQRRLSVVGISHKKATRLETGDLAVARKHQAAHGADYELDSGLPPKTIDELCLEDLTNAEMMKRLGYALRRVAEDLKQYPNKRYSYEEWVEFTRLVRFTKPNEQLADDEAQDGLIEWDWLDSNSPMTSEQSEPSWVMDRLLESLLRAFRKTNTLDAVTGNASLAGSTLKCMPDMMDR
ncbi:Potassium channel [Knufia fluminis]|uniref:Potassium channel n=1 Tax=Knufia fluminis TaxID=191047 RepID=A0AAN8ELS7_9EURO|nr:Potassium channel [Knufia fluminis]